MMSDSRAVSIAGEQQAVFRDKRIELRTVWSNKGGYSACRYGEGAESCCPSSLIRHPRSLWAFAHRRIIDGELGCAVPRYLARLGATELDVALEAISFVTQQITALGSSRIRIPLFHLSRH